MFSNETKRPELFLTLPSFIWLLFFFLIPTLIVFMIAFRPYDVYGGIEEGWTLSNIYKLTTPSSLKLIWRTFWVSILATGITIVTAIPTGYFLSSLSKKWSKLILLAIILPFWTSFLVRIFAWKSLLHPEGFFKEMLVRLYIITPETSLLYNLAAVIFIMVYTYLPFAILPIYAAASKFDFSLFEAAQDLGATRTRAFFQVFIPSISKGILNAMIIVFIPILGCYVIPDVVGSASSEMIGNRIGQKILVARNLPEASAWSLFLTVSILIPVIVGVFIHSRSKKIEVELRNIE